MDKEQNNEMVVLIDDIEKKMENVMEELLNVCRQLGKVEREKESKSLKAKLCKVKKSLGKQWKKIEECLLEIKVEDKAEEEYVQTEKILIKKDAENMLESYIVDMKRNELSDITIDKYVADINQWLKEAPEIISKADLLDYKEKMCVEYKVTSVNSKVISINRYLKWLGYKELTVKTKRMQNANGLENVITKEGYLKMLDYSKTHNRHKMYCMMKTIAQTGIRIGELKFVTVEAVKEGATIVGNKGKCRMVYFTDNLCHELLKYCKECDISSGIIFCGRESGKCITSGAVWKGLKYIAKQVGVPEAMVFPHSFRHLFAKEYMNKIGDISELADLLGHSRLETTWIYTKTTSDEKRRRLELLEL